MTSWPTPPRGLVWLAGLLVLAGGVVLIAGAIRIGATVDETFHVVRLDNFLAHGWYLLDDDLANDGAPGPWVEDRFVYAPVTALGLHALNVVAGHESWELVSTSRDAYLVRHLGIAFIALAGAACAGLMTRAVSGSWRWSVVAFGTMMSLPMWVGHGMFNLKDIPVGTGYSMVTLGCMTFILVSRRQVGIRLCGVALVWCGILLTIGTRPGMWVALAATIAWTGAVVTFRSDRDSDRVWRNRDLLLTISTAILAVSLVYPEAFVRPDRWLLGSLLGSASHQIQTVRTYIPGAVATTVPVVVLLVALVGSLARFALWRRDRRWLTETAPMFVLLLIQTLLLPMAMIITNAPASGGLRHVLFAAPPVAVLFVAGLAQIISDCSGPRARIAVTGLVGIGMLLPSVAQAQLFPYGYGYVNEVVDVMGVETIPDFWQASLAEYAPMLPPNTFVVCGPALDARDRPYRFMPNGGQSWVDLSQNCAGAGQPTVLTPFVGRHEDGEVATRSFVALVVQNYPPPAGCDEFSRVTRRRLLATAVLSRALVCPLVVPRYTDEVTFDGGGDGYQYLLGGWAASVDDEKITVAGRASFGFTWSRGEKPKWIDISGAPAENVQFWINEVPVTARRLDTGWRLMTPTGPALVSSNRNVVVTVEAPQGASLAGFKISREVP